MGDLGTEEAGGLSQMAEQVWAARCPSAKPRTQAGPAQVSGQVHSPAPDSGSGTGDGPGFVVSPLVHHSAGCVTSGQLPGTKVTCLSDTVDTRAELLPPPLKAVQKDIRSPEWKTQDDAPPLEA